MVGYFYHQYNLGAFVWLTPFIFLDLLLKGVVLWKTARNNQKYWFTAMLIVNSLGLLPLLYLFFFQKKKK